MFFPKTKEALQNAVSEWCENQDSAFEKYGDVSQWITSEITDMSELFKWKGSLLLIVIKI